MIITRFVSTLWRASTDANAYVTDFVKRRAGSGLGHLYALHTLLAFFMLLPIAIGSAMLIPLSQPFVEKHADVLRAWYPPELVLTFSGGVLRTNVGEPYTLDLPAAWDLSPDSPDTPTHAIVIDRTGTAETFDRSDTYVLLTEKTAIVRGDDGLRVYNYDSLTEPLVVNSALIEEIAGGADSFAGALPWLLGGLTAFLLLIAPWMLGGIFWLMSLFFLLIATCFVWIIASASGKRLGYGQLYRLGLFGVTSSVLLSFVLRMTAAGEHWITWVLFFAWMTYVLSLFPREASPATVILPPARTLPKKKAPAKRRAPVQKAS